MTGTPTNPGGAPDAILSLEAVSARRGGREVLDGVGLSIAPRETLGLVGASGAGKTTLARIVLGLDRDFTGTRRFAGGGLAAVFQDPYGSLDPMHRIGRIVGEPLAAARGLDRQARRARVLDSLRAVGLGADDLNRLPAELSGGQRQRVAIARALIADPALLVADEPVSALDVSVQAQVLNLLLAARQARRMAMLLISHDLAVIRHLCARVAVLHAGRIVECAPVDILFSRPAHPATRALLAGQMLPDQTLAAQTLAAQTLAAQTLAAQTLAAQTPADPTRAAPPA